MDHEEESMESMLSACFDDDDDDEYPHLDCFYRQFPITIFYFLMCQFYPVAVDYHSELFTIRFTYESEEGKSL